MCISCCLCVKGERGEQGEVGPVGARGGPVSTATAGDLHLQHAQSKSPPRSSVEVIMAFGSKCSQLHLLPVSVVFPFSLCV